LEESFDNLIADGKFLPVMEEFYSLQGEGYNTGQAAFFIRIGGCDVGCKWCDVKESWNSRAFPPVPTDLIIQHALLCPAKSVVVTGGEPLLYNLNYFCRGLHQHKIKIFLETSGSQGFSGEWDWICLSPKKESPPLPEVAAQANELKIIIENISDFHWAEENSKMVSVDCKRYLQPEWSKRNTIMPEIIHYIMENPRWKISLQSHKYMRIP